jgi:hypothetical protein
VLLSAEENSSESSYIGLTYQNISNVVTEKT